MREKEAAPSHIRTAPDMPVMPNKAGMARSGKDMVMDMVMVMGDFRFG